jgi:hypothetical protein
VLFGTFGEHLGVQRCFLGRGCATVRERGDVVVVVVEGVKMLLCIRCMREAEFGVEDGKNVCGLCAGGGKGGFDTARGIRWSHRGNGALADNLRLMVRKL